MNGTMVMVGVYAHKLTELSGSSKSAKLADKSHWIFRQANDSSIDVNDESMGSVNFCAC